MNAQIHAGTVIVLAILTIVTPLRGQEKRELDAKTVNTAIDRAVNFLVSQQDKAKKTWPDIHGQPGGLTALCSLALLNTGMKATDDRVRPALDHLANLGKPRMVYSSSLTIMALAAAYPTTTPDRRRVYAQRIEEHAAWLQEVQIKDRGTNADRRGSWPYSKESGSGDNSNAQYALLALHEAERTLPDLKIDEQTWQLALEYWTSQQRPDGSWSYLKNGPGGGVDGASGSMTCAGISSVIIASGRLGHGTARVQGDTIHCCGTGEDDSSVEKAMRWMGSHFSVRSNPNSSGWELYYLYGLERAGRLAGRRFFYTSKGDARDWYREGSEFLIHGCHDTLSGRFAGISGDERLTPELSTAFALLFLAKGRRPVVMAKLRYGEKTSQDWDLHRMSVQHLTSHIETLWKRDLSWQTIDLAGSRTIDLLESPILFMSGSGAFTLPEEEKRALREYVQQGGFIFAEARQGEGCRGVEFDRSFRDLLAELFPESRLRLLPADHPVWFADEIVDPEYMKPMYGLDTCCRTAVVYCPENLSCFWELKRPLRGEEFSPAVQAKIDAAAAIGANVAAYATNRELKEKLDRPKATIGTGQATARRDSLIVPKLAHGGGSDDAPNAVANLLGVLERQLEVRADPRSMLLPADNAKLFDHPLVYMHGRRSFSFTGAERNALKRYLENGGYLCGDAICAQPEFAAAFRREISAALPEGTWQRIPSDHAIFTNQYRGFTLKSVALRDPQRPVEGDAKLTARNVQIEPYLEGLLWKDRYVAVFSPYDISCALENGQTLECKGYAKEDAARIGANMLLYGLGE